MARLRANYALGTTNTALAATDTTLSGTMLARLPTVASPDVAVVTLHNPTTGDYEIVWVTAHAASATTATILRGQEGTSGAAWPSGTSWTHGVTAYDLDGMVAYQGAWAAGRYRRGSLADEQGSMYMAKVDTTNEPAPLLTRTVPLSTVQLNGTAASYDSANSRVQFMLNASNTASSLVDATVLDMTLSTVITTTLEIGGQADGMAFGLQNSASPLTTVGGAGGSLGLATTAAFYGIYVALDKWNATITLRTFGVTGTQTDVKSVTQNVTTASGVFVFEMDAPVGFNRNVRVKMNGTTLISTTTSAVLPATAHLYESAGSGGSAGTFRSMGLSATQVVTSPDWRYVAPAV